MKMQAVWTKAFMDRWVKDRQEGIQTTAETKTYIQPDISNYLTDNPNYKRAFDAPYLHTMSLESTRYQLYPAEMDGHHVNSVDHDIEVNPDGSRVKVFSGFYHCVDCKLMGSTTTMENYRCFTAP